MGLLIELLRPDDLLSLEVETVNLKLDTSDKANPKLVRQSASAKTYLIFHFPPQSITEQAFFEVDANITTNPKAGVLPASAPALPTTPDTILAAGSVGVRMAGPSRLVFLVPSSIASILFSVEGLLDWSGLQLVVSAVALGQPVQPPLPAPAALETMLEIPWRLALSPGNGVGWIHAKTPVTHQGRTELWHTRLASAKTVIQGGKQNLILTEASELNPVSLRAIWSPDFQDHEPLPLHSTDETPFLSAMSARDRAQIVILTSGAAGYFVQKAAGVPASAWTPLPIQASRLFLSSLGGWLSSRGEWEPEPFYYYYVSLRQPPLSPQKPITAAAKTASGAKAIATTPVKVPTLPVKEPVAPPVKTPVPVFPLREVQALDLTEWVHLATLGRDHYVRIVYDGYLYPFGHRASLIKVTERKVVPPDGQNVTSPTAYMMQHMYIVVRELKKTYPTSSFNNKGREMPFWRKVTIRTKVTPSIDPPTYLGGGTMDSFWVRVSNADFLFHVTAQDLAGAAIDFLSPVIFFGLGEPQPLAVLTEYASSNAQRKSSVAGQKVAFADPSAGDTIVKTLSLYFDAEFLQTGPPYPDSPFVPILAQADVSVSSLDALLGTTNPVTIAYYSKYLTNGLDANAGVFAQIMAPPAITFTADKAGGFATPNLTVNGLSARKGVTSGSLDDAAAGTINPSMFFTGGAMLFGAVPVASIIATNGGTAPAGPNAPEISTKLGPSHKNPTQEVTKISWSPQLTDFPGPPVAISFSSGAALTLQTQITRKLDGEAPTSTMKGELTNFAATLMGVIELQFISLSFSSKNGQKPSVKADLTTGGGGPIAFQNALAFVQQLANVLPSSIFGGGLKIATTSSEIVATLTIGLPALSIGVFSLENISFMAGLDLPFIDGAPGFEFAFAKRSSPFLLTIECLGGGGFVHLIVTSKGVQMVEGALEFGGEFSLDLGVASGGVKIMAGIYFQLTGDSTDLTGFVDISGEVSVLGIISISIDLNLSLSYIVKNGVSTVEGKATLSISVHIIFFSISVSVSVERSFSAGQGDPRIEQLISANDWQLYSEAFA